MARGPEGIRIRARVFRWCLSPIKVEWMLILLLRGLLIRGILNISSSILVLTLRGIDLCVIRGMLITLTQTTIQ
jgi:hypothetical protein